MRGKPSDYEKRAIKEIHLWKNAKLTWFGKAMEFISWPLDKAGDLVLKTPGVGWVIEKSVGGIVSVTNDLAQWSVRPNAIYKAFQARGYRGIRKSKDILTLDLEDVDKVIGWLGAKYKGIATVEGAVTGAVGLPGIPPDVIALVTLNLRAIGEYATYCAFDVSLQQERLFTMNVLGLASSPDNVAKGMAMAQLVRIAKDVSKKKAWKDLEKHSFVKIIQHIAKALGIRLTKAKLAQIIPIAGVAVGGGFNAYYTANVCDAAYNLYRERFLAEKYGEDVIEVTVKPADDLYPDYKESLGDIFIDSLSYDALKTYDKLIEKINAIDPNFKTIPNRDYDNILFHPHKSVALQFHKYHGHLALAIPGSNRRFPKCALKGVHVQALSGYCVTQNRFWLNATRKDCWPPKPAKTFIVQTKQRNNSKVWYQIDRLLIFAKENCERFYKKH